MLKPFTQHTNNEGNILFRFEFIPTNKKPILDRLENTWITTLEFDPILNDIIEGSCSCPDFQINKLKESDCKHLIESKYLINLICSE